MKIRALEISELNEYIKRILNDDPILNNIKVRGEISNFKKHSSGNIYLSLKDEKSKINCMIYKSHVDAKLELEDGNTVIATGYISSYSRDGIYQLYIKNIEKEGLGNLYKEFLKMKNKLASEGIFDDRHKKSIVKFPKKIGVITSETGSVIKDIINVVGRRYPKVEIVLYPASVQGENSTKTLISGLKYFNSKESVDTIIIGRGGGSLEELWSFNDEELARTIFNSNIPVISAVGHETDFTICDFVSDMRAPTPSAAAEIATPNIDDLKNIQKEIIKRMSNSVSKIFEIEKFKQQSFIKRTKNLAENSLNLEKYKLKSSFQRYTVYVEKDMLNDKYIEMDRYLERIMILIDMQMKDKKDQLKSFGISMNNLNPFSVLERGYSVAENNGKIISKKEDVNINDDIDLRVIDGIIKCRVIEKN
ncbi:exodeoxyribonuclease VII large subunit [Peptostreptococcus faecalis]|uniref:exodeoxyribonuclease VII large subunit n=1 Tax=Peptostreptococcus faecalis TaxID=2045015 RepID=UPI000C7A9C5B|nr:exodeoxyribonuclease VII large subunit [Peptostreptococcus faecalis]